MSVVLVVVLGILVFGVFRFLLGRVRGFVLGLGRFIFYFLFFWGVVIGD